MSIPSQSDNTTRSPLSSRYGRKARDTTKDFGLSKKGGTQQVQDKESDEKRLAWRQKQIDFGKNTLGYQRYTQEVPRARRRSIHQGLVPVDPVTPDIKRACSKRAFTGQVLKWRMLHGWDPSEKEADNIMQENKQEDAQGRKRAQAGSTGENRQPDEKRQPGSTRVQADQQASLSNKRAKQDENASCGKSLQGARLTEAVPAPKEGTTQKALFSEKSTNVEYDIFGGWTQDGFELIL